MMVDILVEQLGEALERVAAELLAEAGVSAPPVDAFRVAAGLGLAVARAECAERARFVEIRASGGRRPTILLADDPRPERRQWAVAHEIGEHAAHRVFGDLGLDLHDCREGMREEVANRIAGRLLLPRRWFLADGGDVNWDLFELKARYATASHEMIARRMLEMAPAVIVTVFDQGRVTWRRSNRGRTPPLAPAERDARQAAHDCGRPAWCDAYELPDGVEDVRAWPVHEEGWKREIVRTQLADVEEF